MSIDVITPGTDRVRHYLHDNLPASKITQSAANFILVFDRLRSDNPRILWPEMLGRAAEICLGYETKGLNPGSTIRGALSNGDVDVAMLGLVNRTLVEGFTQVPDTTKGWAKEVEIHDFLPAAAITASEGVRLEDAGKGAASHGSLSLMGQGWALTRFSRQLAIDEKDLLNSSVSLTLLAVRELGKAAKRLVVDLSWATILQNGPMTIDGEYLFSAAHANYLTGAGSDLATGLDSAMSMLAAQSTPDADCPEVPLVLGCQPKYLIVPPTLLATALRQVRRMKQDNDQDLTVVCEPRIALGTVAADDSIVPGKPNGWLLCQSGKHRPELACRLVRRDGPLAHRPTICVGRPGPVFGTMGLGCRRAS